MGDSSRQSRTSRPLSRINRNTLGAAVAVASPLGPDLQPTFLEVTRKAFVQGLHVVSAVSAAIALVAAPIAVWLLRAVRGRDAAGDR
jgi:hypothetical protein